MTTSNSRINPSANNYNPLFPQAGVNQPTQGFRDNFTSIQNNLTTARDEISGIHNTVISVGGTNTDIVGNNVTPITLYDWRSTSLELRIVDNVKLRGTDGVRVPVGSTTNRPLATTSTNGMIRYSQDSAQFELCMNGQWVILGTAGTQYVSRAGDNMAGDLTMGGPSATATGSQLLLDYGTDAANPVLSFRNRTGIGLNANTDGSKMYLIVGSQNRITIQDERTVTGVGSPLDARAYFSDPNTGKHTQVWAQRVGYVYTKDLYLDFGSEMSPLQGVTPSQAAGGQGWQNLLRINLNGMVPENLRGGLTCNFMIHSVNGMDYGFVLTGTVHASFLITQAQNFFAAAPSVTVNNLLTAVDNAAVQFQLVSDVSPNPTAITLQVRCVNQRVNTDAVAIPYAMKGVCTSHQITNNDRYTIVIAP